jgi:hypothetical protein
MYGMVHPSVRLVLQIPFANTRLLLQELCAEDISCFESEAVGHRVDGLDFHKFYFDNGNALSRGGGTNPLWLTPRLSCWAM